MQFPLGHDENDPRDKTPVDLVPFREFREHVKHETRTHTRFAVLLAVLVVLQVASLAIDLW